MTIGGAYLQGNIFYSFENDLTFRVERDEWLYPGLVIDILPSGIALGAWSEGWESVPAGIYVTSEANGRDLLIPDAQPLFSNLDLSLHKS